MGGNLQSHAFVAWRSQRQRDCGSRPYRANARNGCPWTQRAAFLRPCIMWNDQRSYRECEEITRIGQEKAKSCGLPAIPFWPDSRPPRFFGSRTTSRKFFLHRQGRSAQGFRSLQVEWRILYRTFRMHPVPPSDAGAIENGPGNARCPGMARSMDARGNGIDGSHGKGFGGSFRVNRFAGRHAGDRAGEGIKPLRPSDVESLGNGVGNPRHERGRVRPE